MTELQRAITEDVESMLHRWRLSPLPEDPYDILLIRRLLDLVYKELCNDA